MNTGGNEWLIRQLRKTRSREITHRKQTIKLKQNKKQTNKHAQNVTNLFSKNFWSVKYVNATFFVSALVEFLFCSFSFSLITTCLLLFFYYILLDFFVCHKYFTTKYYNMLVYTVIFLFYFFLLFQLFVISVVQYLHTNKYTNKNVIFKNLVVLLYDFC